jgi:hypothetical protein
LKIKMKIVRSLDNIFNHIVFGKYYTKLNHFITHYPLKDRMYLAKPIRAAALAFKFILDFLKLFCQHAP